MSSINAGAFNYPMYYPPSPAPSPAPTPAPTPAPAPTPSPSPAPDMGNKQTVYLTRELDGLNNLGIIGQGIDNVATFNQLLNTPQYKAANYLDARPDLKPTNAVLFGNKASDVLGSNDMFLVGDPFVGGSTNGYQQLGVQVQPGFYTMFKDGSPDSRNIVINTKVAAITPGQNNNAFVGYGMVITDDQGKKTTAQIEGGRLLIERPDKQGHLVLLPGQTHVVGNPADPTAKFYYGTRPGDNEPRLIAEYYERPTEASIQKMIAAGMDESVARNKRTMTQSTFGWRLADGAAANRQSQGNPDGSYWPRAGGPTGKRDGNLTYYDTHWVEGERSLAEITSGNIPSTGGGSTPVAANETGRLFGGYVKDGDQTGAASYLFNQTGQFNLLNDTNVDVRADVAAGATNKVALNLNGNQFEVERNGVLKLNGQTATGNGSMTLQDGTVITKNGAAIGLQTGNYGEYAFNLNAGASDIDVQATAKGIGTFNGFAPTGILGEGFDSDKLALTAPKQPIDNYKVTSLFNASGKPSQVGQLQQNSAPAPAPAPAPVVTTPPSPGAANTGLAALIAQLVQAGDTQGIIALLTQLMNQKAA